MTISSATRRTEGNANRPAYVVGQGLDAGISAADPAIVSAIPHQTDARFRKYQTVAGADRQVMVRSVGFGRGCSIPHSPKVNSYYWTRKFLGAGRMELAAPDIAAAMAAIFAPTSVPS